MAESKLIITTNAPQVVGELGQISDGLKDISKNQKYIFDNAELVAKEYGKTAEAIRETEKAQQSLASTTEKELKREKGLIEDIEDTIKQWEEAKKKAWRVEDIEKFNKKIQEAKKDLKEYETAGIKANENIKKSTDELGSALEKNIKKFGLIALAIGTITKVTKAMVETFKDTVFGLNLMTTAGEVWHQLVYNLVTAHQDLGTSLASALAIGKQVNELRKEERRFLVENTELQAKYQKLYFESVSRTQSEPERLAKINEALDVHNQLIDNQIKETNEQLSIVEQQLVLRPKSNKLLDEEAKLLAHLQTLESQRFSQTKRLEAQRTIIEQELIDKSLDKQEESEKLKLKRQEDYQKASLKLQQEYDKSIIDSLTGEDKLRAQRDYALQQLDVFRLQLLSLGEITPQMEEKFRILALNIRNEFSKAMLQYAKMTPEQKNAISDAITEGIPNLPSIQKSYIATLPEGEEFDFNIWDKLGLSDPEKEEAIKALQEGANTITNILDDIFEQGVNDAERRRDLVDDQISQLQSELEIEAELYEEGYANNVDAKRKELEELKKVRQEALVDEEEAIKKQKAFDTILQTVNLITASTEIMKSFSKIPVVGIPLGIAMIATMFGAFVAAKAKASSSTKLAEGGSGSETGMITGKRHSQGGERFLDHVEVEQGESWGVLSRPASAKYGEVFHDMVSSFNKDQMPSFMPVTNQVNVENSGPNKRLDKVITEQKKLNESILKQSQISHMGSKRVIKTGNKVRIIG
jgi:ribosomal protein S8